MALWQYTFFIIPNKYRDLLFKKLNSIHSNVDFDSSIFWDYSKIYKDTFEDIKTFLPKGKSWDQYMDLYGDLESNCVEILFDNNNKVESVSLRIDFLKDYEIIINNIISLCEQHDFIILDESLNIVNEMKYNYIDRIIRNSIQYKKIRDWKR